MADDLYGACEAALYSARHIPHATLIGYQTGGHIILGDFVDASRLIVSVLGLYAACGPEGCAPNGNGEEGN